MAGREGKICILDLFCGAGGLSEGFHQASERYCVVAAVEMDQSAAASYEASFGKGIVHAVPIQEWLVESDVPQNIDVVIGGPPCQGFSTLGKRDQEDKRNMLWQQYAETINRTKPRYFVMENVPAFLKSKQYEALLASTGKNGILSDYLLTVKILNAADYGVPQLRKRAVVIGYRRDCDNPGFPVPTNDGKPLTVRDALSHVQSHVTQIELPSGRFFEFNGKSYPGAFAPHELHLTRRYSDLSLARFSFIPVGGNRFDIPERLLAPCWKGYTKGATDVMGRLRWDAPSVTIRTEFFKPEKGRYLHPDEDRALTLYEASLLQGFPESHRFVGSKVSIARQIGNAVPIPLGKAIAQRILRNIERAERHG
ncbi:DNA (cytosine-5-)-methyltransferase [Bifidobacterium primatium]|uniref:Cytosine-specific methyltransferase n=2 Tax=Bifidobacterium primatium TaxID=2045438 RepID=A0A2M9H6U0_9BIFI|nr:DNA (cytosine-5-)-methyltransferase [Bifidobacterium primatium]